MKETESMYSTGEHFLKVATSSVMRATVSFSYPHLTPYDSVQTRPADVKFSKALKHTLLTGRCT
jgi:hypothetical protein